jgi:hypothetical protein
MSLAEALMALVVTAVVVALAAQMIGSFSSAGHALPLLGARQASDSRVESMIAELRDAVAITQISPTQVTATISTAGPFASSTIGGAATGTYSVSYAF